MFLLLISVHGVGPGVAVRILSGMNAGEFSGAVQSGNARLLKSIKGVGAKMAERLVTELKDKIGKVLSSEKSDGIAPFSSEAKHAVQGMIALGYKETEAEKAIAKVMEKRGSGLSAEEMITEALRAG